MKAAVIGSGKSGAAIEHALRERGVDARQFSPSTGFDAMRSDVATALAGMDIVIEAQGRFTTHRAVAFDFFIKTTAPVAGAMRRLGRPRHLIVSTLSCDDPDLVNYGYFAGKAMQERVARSFDRTATIVRTAEWFEYAEQNIQRLAAGPLVAVPMMKIRPMALSSAASAIATAALDDCTRGRILNYAGPEVMTLRQMTTPVLPPGKVAVPIPIPGQAGKALRAGAAYRGRDITIAGPTFGDWLAHRA